MEDKDLQQEAPPSKSQRKREADSQQALGETLAALKPAQLDQLPLDDTLREALQEFGRVAKSHGARRRQLQYIGRLMRERDADGIAAAVAILDTPAQRHEALQSSDKQQQLRALADRLLTGGDKSIQELVSQYDELSRQRLRQLSRDYAAASDEGRARALKKTLILLQASPVAKLTGAALDGLLADSDRLGD